jgi:hypothetical protein
MGSKRETAPAVPARPVIPDAALSGNPEARRRHTANFWFPGSRLQRAPEIGI